MKKTARILIMLFVMLMAIPASAKQASAASAPSAPTLSSIENATNGVKLTWTKVSNATGYYVYRMRTGKDSSTFSKIGTVSSGSTVTYTDTTAKNGVEYSYTVKAYNSSGKTSSASNPVGTIMYLTSPGTLKASGSSSTNKITLTWSESSSATGYKVYRKDSSGKYTKIATVKKAATTTYADTEGTPGAVNDYKVTAYYGDYESAGSTKSYTYNKNVLKMLDPSKYYGISADLSLDGSGTGYHTKVVIGWGSAAVSLGIQYDQYAMPSKYAGKRALILENIQDANDHNKQIYTRYPYNGSDYLNDKTYNITLTVEKSTGKICGYVNNILVLTDTNTSLKGQQLYCWVEGCARVRNDSVNATISNVIDISEGEYRENPTVSFVKAAKGLSVSAKVDKAVGTVTIKGSLTSLASNLDWDSAPEDVNGYVRFY